MVYKVSACVFFPFFCEVFFIVAQLELGLTPLTEDPRCKLIGGSRGAFQAHASPLLGVVIRERKA